MLLRIQQVSTGKFFALKGGTDPSVEIHTTFFNAQSDFLSSFSYPGSMPLNEVNQALINNAQYIATDVKLRTFYVMAWLGEIPWKVCKFNFTITDDTIQYRMYYDGTLVSSWLSAVKLTGLLGSYPGLPAVESSQVAVDDLAAYMKSTLTAKPGTMPMVFFPWKNDGAYKPEGFQGRMLLMGMYDAGANNPVLHNNDGTGTRPLDATGGWYYIASTDGEPDWGDGPQAVSAGDLVAMDDLGFWYVTRNPYGTSTGDDQFPNLVFPSNPIMNRWEMDGLGNGSFIIDNPARQCQTQTPFFFVWFIVQRIFQWFGINSITGSAWTDPDFLALTVFTRIALDSSTLINDVSYFMPAITVSDFFKELRTAGFFIDFDMTRNTGIVEKLKNLERTAPVMDLRPYQLAGKGSYRETALTPTYYIITQPADSNDGSFPSNYTPAQLQIGEADPTVTVTDITLTSVATNMVTETAPTDPLISNLDLDTLQGWPEPIIANWRIPYIKQAVSRSGSFDPIVTVNLGDANNFGLRFLYYYGMVQNSAGYTYPYGSSDNQDVGGNTLSSFNLSFSPGLGDFQPLSYYYNFLLNAKPFEQGFLLPRGIVNALRSNMRYLVWDNRLRATIQCLLDQGLLDMKNFAEKLPCKLTLYPITKPDNAGQVTVPVMTPPPPPPYDNGLVYVRFEEINENTIIEGEPTPSNTTVKDIFVSFWADSAGTVPKAVINLPVGIKTVETTTDPDIPATTTDTTTNTYTCNGVSATVIAAAPITQEFTGGDAITSEWVYTLLGSAYYTIIT